VSADLDASFSGTVFNIFSEQLVDNLTPINSLALNKDLVIDAGSSSGYDSDAEAYFSAVASAGGTLSDPQKDAINTFVVNTKADGTWAKQYAIYPLAGGTAASHAINLKSPGTYDITWNGSVTHNEDGIKSDGSTGYGNTNFNPSSAGMGQNDV